MPRVAKKGYWFPSSPGPGAAHYLRSPSAAWQDSSGNDKTFWVRFIWHSKNSQGTVMAKWIGSANRSILLDFGNSQFDFNTLGNNLTGYTASGASLPRVITAQKTAVAGVYKGSASLIFAYTQRAQASGNFASGSLQGSTLELSMGKIDGYGSNFTGIILEWAIWSDALTQNELNALEDGQCPLYIRRSKLELYGNGDIQGGIDLSGATADRNMTLPFGSCVYQADGYQDDPPIFQGRAAQGLIKYLATVAQAQVKTAATVPNASAKKIASVQNV